MDELFRWIGNIANVIGILSGLLAVLAWVKARKYAKKANETLEIIQNYRRVEIFTEVNKKLEKIRLTIRDIGTSKANNVQKRYKEIETVINEIINAIPLKNNDLIEEMKNIEEAIRVNGDNNKKLVGEVKYKVLDSIDFVTTGLKALMEELRQEN